jgi:hypothetical protein
MTRDRKETPAMGTATAPTADVRQLSSARSLRRAPTRGALQWAREALAARGRETATGVVDLGSQRELANRMGLSPGTVARHLRTLGGIVVATVPVQLDADKLRTFDAGTGNGARPEQVVAASLAAHPDQSALLRAAAALIDSVTIFVEALTAATAPTDRPAPVPRRRQVVTRRRATARDEPSRRVASVASLPADSQTEIFPGQEDNPSGCLAQSTVAARAGARRDPSRHVASLAGGRTPDTLTDDQVSELLRPLVKTCRECGRPDKVDKRGYNALRRIPEEQFRYGVSQMIIKARSGAARLPLGLLVSLAQRYAAGDTEFFERPVLHDVPAFVHEAEPVDEAEDDETDPLEGLSPAEVAAIDARIKGRHTMGSRALDSLRRHYARQLRADPADRSAT